VEPECRRTSDGRARPTASLQRNASGPACRADRAAWHVAQFHKLCDGKAPTLTIVKLDDGHIFGGPRSDPLAFLFSLTDGERRAPCFLSQFQHWGFSVHHARDCGPLFGHGAGADLGLDLDEESLLRSRSAVGQTFAIPRRSIREPLVSDTFLAGRLNGWHVDEVRLAPRPAPRPAPPRACAEAHVRRRWWCISACRTSARRCRSASTSHTTARPRASRTRCTAPARARRGPARAPRHPRAARARRSRPAYWQGPPARPFLAEGVLRSLEAAAPGEGSRHPLAGPGLASPRENPRA
jgi:hypothetical protein